MRIWSTDSREDPYLPLWQEWQQAPDPEKSQRLLKELDPVINTAVRSFGGAAPSPTLRSYAKQLTLDALKRYDPARGQIKPYLMSHLRRLYRISARQQQIISIPEAVSMARINLKKNEKELEDRLGRPPSDQELADYTKISIRKLQYLRKAARPVAAGRFVNEAADDQSDTGPATISLADRNYETLMEILYDELSPRQKFILERAAGLHGHKKHSSQDIARSLKISSAAVSQQIAKIQQTLQKYIQFLEGGRI